MQPVFAAMPTQIPYQHDQRRALGLPRRVPGRPDVAQPEPISARNQGLPTVKGCPLTLGERECRSHAGMPAASRGRRERRAGHGVPRW